MQDIIVGVLAIAAGALFCFRGFIALRLMIPIWGAFAGFLLGAGIIAGTGDDGFLRTGIAWVVGFVFALIFSALSYLYYEVSIMLAMGTIGFALGTSLMVAIGVSWSWVIVLVGVGVGVFLALIAMISDLPGVLLMVLGALGGATAIVGGAMLLTGVLETADFTRGSVTEVLDDRWWWYVAYLVIAVAGMIVQSRELNRLVASARQAFLDAGGKELRPSSPANAA